MRLLPEEVESTDNRLRRILRDARSCRSAQSNVSIVDTNAEYTVDTKHL